MIVLDFRMYRYFSIAITGLSPGQGGGRAAVPVHNQQMSALMEQPCPTGLDDEGAGQRESDVK